MIDLIQGLRSKGVITPEIAAQAICDAAERWGKTPAEIVARNRKLWAVRARMDAISDMHDASMSCAQIAIAMDRDHTSISNMLRKAGKL